MTNRAAFAAVLLALAGCGNLNQGNDARSALVSGLRGMIPGLGGAESPGSAAQSASAVAQSAPAGTIFFEVPAFSVASPGVPASVINDKVTWLAAPISVTTQFGFLIATRGMPEDVMAIEVSGFGEALTSGGTYQRDMEWLSRRDEVKRTRFTCTIVVKPNQSLDLGNRVVAATLYEDTCIGGGLQFTNHYWVDGTKVMRKTRQWVSESVGYLQTTQL